MNIKLLTLILDLKRYCFIQHAILTCQEKAKQTEKRSRLVKRVFFLTVQSNQLFKYRVIFVPDPHVICSLRSVVE